MRFMVLVKANDDSEAGVLPSAAQLDAMSRYNEELIKAGVILDGGGLRPSSDGVRVRFENGKTTVTDGPFTETKELVAGYWIWQVASKEEAVEWLKRAPFDHEAVVELRQFHEDEDFAEVMDPATREREERMRAQMSR